MPRGGNIPADSALNARSRSPSARVATSA